MNSLYAIIIVIQVVAALAIIGLVLIQHGKGADMGAAFGSGASGSLFGASGSSNFLSRSTGVAAAVFFIATLTLSFLGSRPPSVDSGAGVMDQIPSSAKTAAPATTTPASAGAPATAPAAAPAQGKSGEIPK
jgi:preprotein translocase subunit SecG